jgi:Predicted RNA-binding protein
VSDATEIQIETQAAGAEEESVPQESAPAVPSERDETLSEQDLVEEGDIAADYIEELLDISDIDGDIDIDARSGRAYVSVTATEGANLRLLSKPDTVAALQELARLAVQNKTGRFSRMILDIGGSRDQRAAELATLVDRAVAGSRRAQPRRPCLRCRAMSGRSCTTSLRSAASPRSPRVRDAIATR